MNLKDTLAKTGASIVALVAAFACVLNIFNYYYNNGAASTMFVTGFISLIFAYAWLRPQCSTCTPVINWMFTIAVMVQPSHAAIQGAGYGVATMVCLFVSTILMFTKSPRYGTVVLLVSLAIMNISVNLIWENMNHEHYTAYEKTMYNIMAFMIWAVIYRLSGIMWEMHRRDAAKTTYFDTALKVGKLGLVRRQYQPEDWERELIFDEESEAIFSDRQNNRLIGVIQDFNEEGRETFLTTCTGTGTLRKTVRWKDSKWVDIERFIVNNESIWLVKDVTDEYETNKRLTEHLDRLETLADVGEIVFVEVDLKTRMVYANRRWRDRWGYGDDELVNWDEFLSKISSKFRHHFNNRFHEVMITKKPVDDTLQSETFIDEYNRRSWHRIRISPVVENGKVVKMRIANMDVTDLVEAQTGYAQALRQLEASIEGGQIGVFTHYLNTNTMEVNKHYRTMRNLPLEGEITFEQATQYMTPLDESLGSYNDVLLAHREQNISKTTVLFDDGVDKRYQRLVSTPIRNSLGELIAMTGTVFDITEEYEARSALEESQAKQEEITAHLEESMAELEEKRQQEKQMLAVIGHELRTPAAMLQMLTEDLIDLGDGKIQRILSTVMHMTQVLDDLRSIANPSRQLAQDIKRLRLCDAVEETLHYLIPLSEGTEFVLNYHAPLDQCPYDVNLSKQLLRQVLTNLIKNAIKYSNGSTIDVTLDSELRPDENYMIATITVADDGDGVAVEERGTLFEPFVRGKHVTSDGTGLGLSIVKSLVESANGKIEYRPNIPKGASFVITLNLPIFKDDPKHQTMGNNINILEGKTVLLAEDNQTIQALTKKMLEVKGCTVTVADNGKIASELLAKSTFDIILSDIFMPECDGYEFVTRARGYGYSGPIIACTAASIGDEQEQMIAAGADACLTKPLNLAKLNKALIELDASKNVV